MIKVAINGFGRIGRQTFRRIIDKHPELEVVAVNDLTDNKTLAHLLKYDSVYGVLDKEINFSENGILVEGREYKVLNEKDPEKLPWKNLKIDVVLECTGFFTDAEGAKKHLRAGAKKVIISAPCKEKETPGFILGVNADKYNSKETDIMDMGSCTTNCLAPIAKVLNDNFKIIK